MCIVIFTSGRKQGHQALCLFDCKVAPLLYYRFQILDCINNVKTSFVLNSRLKLYMVIWVVLYGKIVY